MLVGPCVPPLNRWSRGPPRYNDSAWATAQVTETAVPPPYGLSNTQLGAAPDASLLRGALLAVRHAQLLTRTARWGILHALQNVLTSACSGCSRGVNARRKVAASLGASWCRRRFPPCVVATRLALLRVQADT